MKALVINCMLKKSPESSNTGALADVVAKAPRGDGVGAEEVFSSEILLFSTPT